MEEEIAVKVRTEEIRELAMAFASQIPDYTQHVTVIAAMCYLMASAHKMFETQDLKAGVKRDLKPEDMADSLRKNFLTFYYGLNFDPDELGGAS